MNDPDCTFHPQLSEMSQLIMRGSQHQGFMHRNECWKRAYDKKVEEAKNSDIDDIEIATFKPELISKKPKLGGPSVVTKTGVAKYLDRLNRAEQNHKLQSQKKPTVNFREPSTLELFATKSGIFI